MGAVELFVSFMLFYSLPALWLFGLSKLGLRAARRYIHQPRAAQPPPPATPPPRYETIAIWPLLDLNGGPFTREEILAAYRRRAKLFHPDRGATAEAFIALVHEREEALKFAH